MFEAELGKRNKQNGVIVFFLYHITKDNGVSQARQLLTILKTLNITTEVVIAFSYNNFSPSKKKGSFSKETELRREATQIEKHFIFLSVFYSKEVTWNATMLL